MSERPPILERMMRKFARRAELGAKDRQALLELPYTIRVVEAGRYIAREGTGSDSSALILSGIAFRHKLTVDGLRQIVSIHIAGDFVDLDGSLLAVADHNVQALTRCELALIPSRALIAVIDTHPQIGRAMWVDTLVDASIFREWVLNVGRRDAKGRVAHILCELARRMEVAGLADKDGYEFPMTQEQLADATGLTSVHVNRTLKALEKEGLLQRQRRFVSIPDWDRLRSVAGFNELYLHLDQVGD
jgi:CRP-like cAMP-binding protein